MADQPSAGEQVVVLTKFRGINAVAAASIQLRRSGFLLCQLCEDASIDFIEALQPAKVILD